MALASTAIVPTLLGSSEDEKLYSHTKGDEDGATSQRSSLQQMHEMRQFTLLVFLSILAVIFSVISFQPLVCIEVKQCAASYGHDDNDVSTGMLLSQCCAAAIVAMCVREAIQLVVVYVEESDPRMKALGVPVTYPSSLLLCGCLLILSVTEVALCSSRAWDHAVPPVKGFRAEWGSVPTLRYTEWTINVPLLLLLSGHVVLGRPVSETLPAIAITNVYIILAWVATIRTTSFSRWSLIIVTFGLYGWATYDMGGWIRRYVKVAPKMLPGRCARPLLLVWLNVFFALYGLIYLLDIFGFINAPMTIAMYEICDCSAKVSTACFLAYLRYLERRDAMNVLVAVHSRMSRASESVLRSSFDYLLPCTIDTCGNCYVLDVPNADTRAIELLTGRALAGKQFIEILVSERDRELFHSHVQTALQQEDEDWAAEIQARNRVRPESTPFWDGQTHFRPATSMAPVFNYDIHGADAQGTIPVSMHLSSATGMFIKHDSGPSMIIAISVMEERTAVLDAVSDLPSIPARTMRSSSKQSSSKSMTASSRHSSLMSSFRRRSNYQLPGEPLLESPSISSAESSCRELTRVGAIHHIPDVFDVSSSMHAAHANAYPISEQRRVTFSVPPGDSEKSSASQLHSQGAHVRTATSLSTDDIELTMSSTTQMSSATQTAAVLTRDSSAQTSIVWSSDGLQRTSCAKTLPTQQHRIKSPSQPTQKRSSSLSSRSSSGSSEAPSNFNGHWMLRNEQEGVSSPMRFLSIGV